MIKVTAKYNLQNMLLTEADYFKETIALVSHKYSITIEGLTYEESEFLVANMREGSTWHSWKPNGDTGDTGRHNITVSAQGMINFGRAVFCPQEDNIVDLIQKVVAAVVEVDKDLAAYLVSDCVYRNGVCTRDKPCGRSIEVLKDLVSIVPERYYRDARNEKLVNDVRRDKGEFK